MKIEVNKRPPSQVEYTWDQIRRRPGIYQIKGCVNCDIPQFVVVTAQDHQSWTSNVILVSPTTNTVVGLNVYDPSSWSAQVFIEMFDKIVVTF